MDEYIDKINEYILYREKMQYKEMLGYSISNDDIKKLDALKREALKAKYFIEEENKRLKKILKNIK